MSVALRIVLICCSILNCGWVLLRIRKSRFRIDDSIFWILFSVFLIVISLFPSLMTTAAKWIGVKSPVNFLFLVMLFLMQVKLFLTSVHISQLEEKLKSFAQRYALDQKEQTENERNERNNVQ